MSHMLILFSQSQMDHSSHIASWAEFPWAVSVFEDKWSREGAFEQLLSTGSLIHPQIVITTASSLAR